MTYYNFKVLIEPDETSGFVVECPQLKGCYSQGDTLDEALDNIKEVIDMCLEELEEQKQVIAFSKNILVTDVMVAR